jgi:hypothetical protein
VAAVVVIVFLRRFLFGLAEFLFELLETILGLTSLVFGFSRSIFNGAGPVLELVFLEFHRFRLVAESERLAFQIQSPFLVRFLVDTFRGVLRLLA